MLVCVKDGQFCEIVEWSEVLRWFFGCRWANIVMGCRGLCVVYSWQNGTRCRDGVNVLWCHSYLVWLVFEGSIPTCACFHSENIFVTCSCCFLFFFELF